MSDTAPHNSLSVADHTPKVWPMLLCLLMIRYGPRSLAGLAEYVADKNDSPHTETIKNYSSAFVSTGAGLLSSYGVATHAYKSYNLIKGAYTETVAMEKGKDPKDVGIFDLIRSKNTMVREAIGNYIKFNSIRALVSCTFFIGPIAKIISETIDPGGKKLTKVINDNASNPTLSIFDTLSKLDVDAGMAATGILYFLELSRNKTSHEETADYLIQSLNKDKNIVFDSKINSLYKIYNQHFKHQNRCDVPENKRGDLQVMFQRMHELMQVSYQREGHQKEDNFDIPQFEYLLGHGKLFNGRDIDATKSMLYIEVMFKHGAAGVKEVDKLFKAKISPTEIAEKMGVIVDVEALREKYRTRDEAAFNTTVKPQPISRPKSPQNPHAQQQGQMLHQHATAAPAMALGHS